MAGSLAFCAIYRHLPEPAYEPLALRHVQPGSSARQVDATVTSKSLRFDGPVS